MELKGTRTAQNILAALQGESVARNRYTFFEEQARKEGNQRLADLFGRMAQNETHHAKIWYKLAFGLPTDSSVNLQTAASGENEEWRSMYPGFAEIAREEGLEEVAKLFEQVARIECDHERLFLQAFVELQQQSGDKAPAAAAPVEEAPAKPLYRCVFCGAGYEHRPDVCPLCGAIGSFDLGTQA